MRAVVQRVARARVVVDGATVGAIGPGMLVLLGVDRGDVEADAQGLAEKLATFRFFGDEQGRMNRSVGEVGGGVLVVSQFTLCADVHKGRRPSFVGAELPERAQALCEHFVATLAARGLATATGRFGARMEVELLNDGPVTLVFEAGLRAAAG